MVLPGRADDRVEFRRLVPADADLLVEFLSSGVIGVNRYDHPVIFPGQEAS